MRAITIFTGILFAVLLCGPQPFSRLSGRAAAGETAAEKQEREERELAAQEDEADHEAGRDSTTTLTGTVELLPPPAQGQTSPSVIGTFTEKGTGRAYALKLATEGLRSTLTKYDHKEVKLAGKIRNQGKYLIVQDVIEQYPPPPPFKVGGGRGKNF